MNFKFLILGPQKRDLHKIIDAIETKNNNFVICKKFTNDITYKDTENVNGFYYLDNQTLNTSLKNNALLYAVTNEQYTTGVTVDDFYNSDILYMSIAEFNNISSNFISNYKDNIVIVWLDTKHHIDNKLLKKDIYEVNYLVNKINEFNYNYIYLLDESPEYISDIINEYFYGDESVRQQILDENN